jgi:hypothetical protein
MVEIVINKRERKRKIARAQQVFNWAKSHFRQTFKTEVIDFIPHHYRVNFLQRGKVIRGENIPRRYIEDCSIEKRNITTELKSILDEVEKITEGSETD